MISELDDFERDILTNIERFGCHINWVSDPDSDQPPFAYSVGFVDTVDQPEVIVFGLDGKLMQYIIMETLEQCKSGLKLADGMELDNLLSNYKVVVRAVLKSWIVRDYFNSAMWRYRRRSGTDMTQAYQLVWPCPETGLFPWDSNFPHEIRDCQPVLYGPMLSA